MPPGLTTGGAEPASPSASAQFAETLDRLAGSAAADTVEGAVVAGPPSVKDSPESEDESNDDAADTSASDVGFCDVRWQTICVLTLPVQPPEAAPVAPDERPDSGVEQSTGTPPADLALAAIPSPLAQPSTDIPPTSTAAGVPAVTSALSSTQAMPRDGDSADGANAVAEDMTLAIDEAPAVENKGSRPAPSQSGRSLARALAILERVDPTKAAAQATEASQATQLTHADGAAAAELGRAGGTVDSPVPAMGTVRQAAASDSVSQLTPLAGAQAQSGGGAASFGAASEGQGGSARQEYGRRAFAAVAALDPSLETHGAHASPAPDGPAAPAGTAVSPLRPSDVTAPQVVGTPQSPVEEGEVVSQLVRAMRTQFRDGVGEARIRLNPEHLGEVRIDIKIDGDRVSAVLHVERSDVRQAIEAQSHSLRSGLATQGLNLEELTVREGERTRDERGGADENRRGRDQPPPERRSRQRQPDREFELGGDV